MYLLALSTRCTGSPQHLLDKTRLIWKQFIVTRWLLSFATLDYGSVFDLISFCVV
jgi:hypothetical protein